MNNHINDTELRHHGILGQKWGIRRYQNPDGSLTAEGQRRLQQKTMRTDTRWAKKNEKKITKAASKAVEPYMNQYVKNVLQTTNYRLKSGKVSRGYINEYNRQLAKLMTMAVSEIETPSGRTVSYVAKRGQIGAMMAIADKGYDFSTVKNGVWNDGRIAYKKKTLDKIEY